MDISKYNKALSFDNRKIASSVLTDFFNQLKTNRGDIDKTVKDNPDTMEYDILVQGSGKYTHYVRITTFGLAFDVLFNLNKDCEEMDWKTVADIDPRVGIYETDDSDCAPVYEDYRYLTKEFVALLRTYQDVSPNRNTLRSVSKKYTDLINTMRVDIADLVRIHGTECATGTYTLAFAPLKHNPTWEGFTFYRVMVEELGVTHFELCDVKDNYVQSNDINDGRFLLELYQTILDIAEGKK